MSTQPPPPEDDKVLALNPDPDKQGTRIDRWKYEAVQKALLEIIPRKGRILPDGDEGVPFGELAKRVKKMLPRKKLEALGSVGWYTTVVKLDLEARGEIRRVPGSRPQRLTLKH